MKNTICMLILAFAGSTGAGIDFETWHKSDKWDVAGNAMLNQDTDRRLVGQPGSGVLIKGREGKCQ